MSAPRESSLGVVFLALACLVVAGAQTARAVQHTASPERLQALDALPASAGDWASVPMPEAAVNPSILDEKGRPIALYDKIVSRTYRRPDGATVMFLIAYKLAQYQENRIHRPELCYFAQGYVVRDRVPMPMTVGADRFQATRFLADGTDRREQVLYWIRSGYAITSSAWRERGEMFAQGLLNRVPDGILVRASLLSSPGVTPDLADGDRKLEDFMKQMLQSSAFATRAALVGPTLAQAGPAPAGAPS